MTSVDPELAKTLSGALLHQLTAEGQVRPRWAEVMRAVPRHLFIPEVIYRYEP